jgi:hypothetical protein
MIWKVVKGSGHSVILDTILTFAWSDIGKPRKCVRTASFLAKVLISPKLEMGAPQCLVTLSFKVHGKGKAGN